MPQNAQRLCIYISESDQWRSKALHAVLLQILKEQDIAGATVFRGMAGFGAHSRVSSTSLEVLSMDLPIVIEAIDTPEKIHSILSIIDPMIREGLITLEDVQLIKYTHRYLNPLPADCYVSECMTRDPVTLSPDMNIAQAWKLMLTHALKAIPVVDAEQKVVGIITDEDMLVRAGIQQRLSVALRLPEEARDQQLQELENSPKPVAEVMSKPVITIPHNETLTRAVSLMVKSGLKRLPVLDEEGKLVGVLSRLDILRQVVDAPINQDLPELPGGSINTISDIMRKDVPTISHYADLPTLINAMLRTGSHRVIVIDDEGKAIGLISDSDIIARVQPGKHKTILQALLRHGSAPSGKETAGELMSHGILGAQGNTPIIDAIKLMMEHERKWLVVLNEEGKPIGLIDRQSILLFLDSKTNH
jgi:CBS domain-containing protein